MADLDNGSVGIKLAGKLPEGNGLPQIAAELLGKPRSIFALVELRVAGDQHRYHNDSYTVVVELAQIEPLDGVDADGIREQLDAVRENRTGVTALAFDEQDAPDVPDALGGGSSMDDVPEFDAPTPIGKAKKA